MLTVQVTLTYVLTVLIVTTAGSSQISQTCSGCGSLPTDDDGTFYYCPRSDEILVIHCDVNQGGSLVWTAPPLFDSNNRVDFSALDTAPSVETRDFATFVLVSIDVGPGGAQNDFRSTMTFITKNITDFDEFTIDEFTIVCQTGTNSASITLKPLGNLTVPMSITSESTLLSSEENEYFIFFTWKYSGGIEIEDFTTQLFTDGELQYELSVPAKERSSTCNITRQESSIYVVMIIANGFCGDNMTDSAMITFENATTTAPTATTAEVTGGGDDDVQINVGYAVMVVLFVVCVGLFVPLVCVIWRCKNGWLVKRRFENQNVLYMTVKDSKTRLTVPQNIQPSQIGQVKSDGMESPTDKRKCVAMVEVKKNDGKSCTLQLAVKPDVLANMLKNPNERGQLPLYCE